MFSFPVLLTIDDESYCKYVEDILERYLLLLHLLVYRERGLCPDLKLIFDAVVRKFLLKRLDELGHQLLPVAFCALEFVGDGPVLLRLCVTEVDILHLALYVV